MSEAIRDAYESRWPMPANTTRCGDRYAATEYGAWSAHDYATRFEGFRAGWDAALAQQPATAAPDSSKLVASAESLLRLDAAGSLAPHGIGGLARKVIEGFIALAKAPAAQEQAGWVSVAVRLPEPGVTVMVYSPPQPGDYPDDVRITFDGIDPDSDGAYWVNHGEHYEHYCYVAKGGDHDWTGPSEKAPYTHWMPLPAIPAITKEGADHE